MATDTKEEVETEKKATAATEEGNHLISKGVLLPPLLSHLTLKEFKQASTVNKKWQKTLKEQKVPPPLSPKSAQDCVNLLLINPDAFSIIEVETPPFGLKTAALSRLCYLKLLPPHYIPISHIQFGEHRASQILKNLSNQRHLISSFYEAIVRYDAYDVSSDIEASRVARSCLALLEETPSHTDALYEMAYLIENKSRTLGTDHPIFKNWTDCDYLQTSSSPEDEKNPSSLPIYSSAAYVRYQDSLFYISNGNTRFEEIKLTSEQVKKLDDAITPRKTTRTLSTSQLEAVRQITGHTHNKQSLKDPDLQACFLYRRILAIDPGHSNALAGLAKQIIRGTTKARPSDFPNLEISQIPTNPNEQAKILCLRALKNEPNHVPALCALAKLIDEAKIDPKTTPFRSPPNSRNLLAWEESVRRTFHTTPEGYRHRDNIQYTSWIDLLKKDLHAARLFNKEPFLDYNRVSKAAFLEKMRVEEFGELTRKQRRKFHTIENAADIHFDFLIKSVDLENEEEKRALRRLAEIHDFDKAKDSVLHFLNNPTDRARIIRIIENDSSLIRSIFLSLIATSLIASGAYGLYEWDLDRTFKMIIAIVAAVMIPLSAAVVAPVHIKERADNRMYTQIFSVDPSNNPLKPTDQQPQLAPNS